MRQFLYEDSKYDKELTNSQKIFTVSYSHNVHTYFAVQLISSCPMLEVRRVRPG